MLLFSFKNLTYGLCIFLITRILIPENVRLPFGNISLNTGIIVSLFIMTIFHSIVIDGKIRCNKNFYLAISAFCIYCFFSLILSDYSDFKSQIGYLLQFIITDLLPALLALSIIKNKNDILLIVKVFLAICYIVTLYSILSYILQNNPYRLFWSTATTVTNKVSTVEKYWYGDFTTSTFVSSNSLGYFIGLSFPFVAFLYDKNIYGKYSKFALVLLAISALLGKKRTTIVVLICYGLMWFISADLKKRLKYLAYTIPIIVTALIAIFSIPSLQSIRNVVVTSLFFWNDNVYNSITMGNGGSDWTLRLRQISYPFIEIKRNILFGHGFGWCSWYLSRGVIHPKLFGFETLIAQAICEFGLMSFLLYTFIFVGLYKFASVNSKNKYVLLFVITSIIQMLGTGAIYWYLELLLIIFMRLIYVILEKK